MYRENEDKDKQIKIDIHVVIFFGKAIFFIIKGSDIHSFQSSLLKSVVTET